MTEVSQKVVEILQSLVEKKSEGLGKASGDMILAMEFDRLGFDSLEKMELIMQVEDTFSIALDEDDVIACRKVSDLVALIEKSAS